MADYKNPEWYGELYDKYGIKPRVGSHHVTSYGTCAIGIVCVEFGIDTLNSSTNRTIQEVLAQKLDADPNFLSGVVEGFDTGACVAPILSGFWWQFPAWREGFEVGRNVYQRMNEKGEID